MEQEWERTHEIWVIRKEFLRGVAANFQEALTKTGTPNSRASTPPTATQPPFKFSNISTHNGVHSTAAPNKNLRLAYYTEWDSEIHLTAFSKRLDDDQIHIERFGITISNEHQLQFYLKQMYASNHFDKKEMTE
jgi:hypothetical protein